METATIFLVGFANGISKGALLLVSDNPMTPEGVKSAESDRTVTERFVAQHLSIGIDALRELERLREELVGGQPLQTQPNLSVLDYFEQWLRLKAKRLRRNVAEHYVDVLERHIVPHLGHLRLDQVTRREVEAWVAWAETAKRPVGPKGERGGADYAEPTLRTWWRSSSRAQVGAALMLTGAVPRPDSGRSSHGLTASQMKWRAPPAY